MSDQALVGTVPTWTLGDRLRKAREEAGLQQKDVADALGISRNSVGNYEAGHTKPRRLVLQAWAFQCGVSYGWLKDGHVTGISPEPAG